MSFCTGLTEHRIPAQQKALPLPAILQTPCTMTNEEILKAVRQDEGLAGMTVNERLYVSGLMNEFDKSKMHDKIKAAYILELLQVDKPSIDKILS